MNRKLFFIIVVAFLAILPVSVTAQSGKGKINTQKINLFLRVKSDSVFTYLESVFSQAFHRRDTAVMVEAYLWQLRAIDNLDRLNKLPEVLRTVGNEVEQMAGANQKMEIERLKGRLFWRSRNFARARESFIQLKRLAELSNDTTALVVAYNNLGLIFGEQGLLDSALNAHRKALEINRKQRNYQVMAETLNLMGNACLRLNKYSLARQYYEEAVQIAKQGNNPDILAKLWINLAKNSQREAKIERALQYLDSSEQIWRKVNNQAQLADVFVEKGAIYRIINNYVNALENYSKALEIRKQLNDKMAIASLFNNIGTIYRDLNMSDVALKYYQQALTIYQDLKNDFFTATTLNFIGGVYYKSNRYDHALDYFLSALGYFELVDDKIEMAKVLINVALMYKNLGNYDQSVDYYQQALHIFKEINDQKRTADVLGYMANLYLLQKKYSEAEKMLNEALRLRKQIDDEQGVSLSKYDLAMVAMAKGDYMQAESLLVNILRNDNDLLNLEYRLNITKHLCEIFEKTGQIQKAYTCLKQHSSLKDSLLNIEMLQKLAELKYQTEAENYEKTQSASKKESDSGHGKLSNGESMVKKPESNRLITLVNIVFGGLLLVGIAVFVIYRQRQKKKAVVKNEHNRRLEGPETNAEFAPTVSPEIIYLAALTMHRTSVFELLRETQIKQLYSSEDLPFFQVLSDQLKALITIYEMIDDRLVVKLMQGKLQNEIFDLRRNIDETKRIFSILSSARNIAIQNLVDENVLFLANPTLITLLSGLMIDYIVSAVNSNAIISVGYRKAERQHYLSFSCDSLLFSQINPENFSGSDTNYESLASEDVHLSSLQYFGLLSKKAGITVQFEKFSETGTKISLIMSDLLDKK